jgi:hypothetical protein
MAYFDRVGVIKWARTLPALSMNLIGLFRNPKLAYSIDNCSVMVRELYC